MGCNPVNVFVPQVTRIPIAGPAPYNTLVCCTAGGLVSFSMPPGHLVQFQFTAWTDFVLAGFQQRTPPQFEHSTSGWLAAVGSDVKDNWLFAIDDVASAGFDPVGGRFKVTVDLAMQYPQAFYTYEVYICSYVLVYEPPLPQPAPGAHDKPSRQRLHEPPRHLLATSSPAARPVRGLSKRFRSVASVFGGSIQLIGQPASLTDVKGAGPSGNKECC
jgi:hypothetical protein